MEIIEYPNENNKDPRIDKISRVFVAGQMVDFLCAVECMNMRLYDFLNSRLGDDVSDQGFVDRYCQGHLFAFGEEFTIETGETQ